MCVCRLTCAREGISFLSSLFPFSINEPRAKKAAGMRKHRLVVPSDLTFGLLPSPFHCVRVRAKIEHKHPVKRKKRKNKVACPRLLLKTISDQSLTTRLHRLCVCTRVRRKD